MKSSALPVFLLASGLIGAQASAAEPAKTEASTDKDTAPAKAENPVVVIETSLGTIKAELWPDKVPQTVKNFLAYTDEKSYDGTIFHRVISKFMIQGGGFTADMSQKSTHSPIKNEAKPELQNKRGTLAMARTAVVDSATSQFFINLVDNGFLNQRDRTPRGFGYCVFGKVIDGLDVVDKIGKVGTGRKGGYSDVPVVPVVIKSVRRAAD